MGNRWWTVGQIADELGLCKMTVYRRIHAGEIQAVKVGKSYRVKDSDFKQYLVQSRVGMEDGDSRD
jgi:excisionase family DNA binding protein